MKASYSLSFGLAALLCSGTALAQKYDGSGSPTFIPHTLQEAMASAYLTNPTLQQERATLRSTDEGVPAALAGWRPRISASSSISYYSGASNFFSSDNLPLNNRRYSTPGYTAGVNLQQNVYTGGKTTASTHQAVNKVMAERAKLLATEQQILYNVVQAYVEVIQDEQLLQLRINNEKVLQEQLRATNERFKVGEITRTDVAQAEAALASARAQRQQAEGTLQTAQATYMQIVGTPPPPNLVPPQPLVLPVKTQQEAIAESVANNPNIINALFEESAAKDAVSVAFAAVMPQLSATLGFQRNVNQQYNRQVTYNKSAILQLTVPVYQGGSEYAAIRQAKQQVAAAHKNVDIQRRSALQLAASNWQQLMASKASINSSRAAIAANVVALDGVERQAIVGTSTTLEVLQQQQTLLSSQIALVQNLSSLVLSSYNVAAAIGRLTAADLKLNVPHYDYTAYYRAVEDKLWGVNDEAVDQPGR
ncbi:TolC family outer membrane protein [Entomobacter blattae]|uniref:Outer membrane efflux protein BepC n=1 Tax=Entomobacter blattae TaxID=2762277 RepID=A0A7H1NT49_9PROT|nr:TolC family outer membrane protein [Entomobacter blattae]QNT78959.1 Outer membrane efflux protein BepC [Entomobacter blattae]